MYICICNALTEKEAKMILASNDSINFVCGVCMNNINALKVQMDERRTTDSEAGCSSHPEGS